MKLMGRPLHGSYRTEISSEKTGIRFTFYDEGYPRGPVRPFFPVYYLDRFTVTNRRSRNAFAAFSLVHARER